MPCAATSRMFQLRRSARQLTLGARANGLATRGARLLEVGISVPHHLAPSAAHRRPGAGWLLADQHAITARREDLVAGPNVRQDRQG